MRPGDFTRRATGLSRRADVLGMARKLPALSVDLFTALSTEKGSALISWEDAPAELEFLPTLTDAMRNDPEVIIHATYADALRVMDDAHRTFARGEKPTTAKLRSVARPMLAAEISAPFRIGAMNAPSPVLV